MFLSLNAIDTLLSVGPTPAPAPANVPAVAPPPLTRRRVGAALEALAHECLRLADAVEHGAVQRAELPTIVALVGDAREAVAERMPVRNA